MPQESHFSESYGMFEAVFRLCLSFPKYSLIPQTIAAVVQPHPAPERSSTPYSVSLLLILANGHLSNAQDTPKVSDA